MHVFKMGITALYQEQLSVKLTLSVDGKGDAEPTRRYYVHAATTIKAKDMNVKILGNIPGEVELNQNTSCLGRLSKWCITNISETAYNIKLKLLGYVELTKRHCVLTNTTKAAITASSTTNTKAFWTKLKHAMCIHDIKRTYNQYPRNSLEY